MGKTSGRGLAILKKADIPFEAVILTVGGMTLLITGALLFPVYRGILPYYENGVFGLLLIVFALQMITLGKTPFGDVPRSKPLLSVGVLVAALGMITCFIPLFSCLPRLLLFFCFGLGGLILLLQMCFDEDKLKRWAAYGGIFWHLIFGCASVYILSILIAIIIWKQNLMTTPFIAFTILIFGMVILYLALVLWKIYRQYPEVDRHPRGSVALSADQAMLILMGVFMLILGVLLIPVSLGMIPFSPSAQLGLLMVIFAIQMLAFGSTPIGPFTRSWLMVGFGLLFAALGIVSCIIPGILVSLLTVLVGVLNLLGGIITLVKMWVGHQRQPVTWPHPVSSVLARLFLTQLILNILAIMFGTSMLIPGLVPGLIIGVILAANGGVLLYLLHVLIVLDRIRAEMEVLD
ncbi:MAG TPA: hypothetical protein PLT64_07590 [Syntrophales bacterium]|nr:hypothetical protein [Syntrophales bacterium]HOL59710.1 hypothetical protein [Syntrophales bacterium]HPO35856.1 hypothetical protein [Syntrophales bacterium]